MSLGILASQWLWQRFPRVSGDEPQGRESVEDAPKFSPRERG